MKHSNKQLYTATLGILIAALLRVITSLHDYSGMNKPPMYGDYEAQRHWMEITLNLPVGQWYRNTSDNDLMYWGLDYPPLTAYHSYLNGYVASIVDRQYVKLHVSRGYESDGHKLFMRYTVLIVDLIIFFPAVVYYFWLNGRNGGKVNVKTTKKNVAASRMSFDVSIYLTLIYPGLILIDHGHFQYNCVSLGFFVAAVCFIRAERFVLTTIFFCLALNYKQMELYHAFPFFLYLLSACVPKPNGSIRESCFKLAKISVTVILCFATIWSPFLFDAGDLFQVVHRLFPVARGLFEDKVANVWCALNVVYKFKSNYCNEEMLRICTIATLVTVLPSSIDLFVRPNVRKFVPSLINSSLAFFLFSFQVHEKTILLAAVPACLLMPEHPIASFWFLVVSNFSMFPLLVKDNLTVAFYALNVFYAVSFRSAHVTTYGTYDYRREARALVADLVDPNRTVGCIEVLAGRKRFVRFAVGFVVVAASIVSMTLLTFSMLLFEPPARYPDLYPLLVSVWSCVHFIGFFVYFNYLQLRIPQGFDEIKLKSS